MLTRSVWSLPAPDIGHHLPGGACSLDASPAPRRPVTLESTRVLHGLVTALSGLPHHPTTPTIALAPWPEGLGWAAYVCTDGAARAMAGRTHGAHLFGRPCSVRCGPLMRLRAPVVSTEGPRELVVRTATPLIVRGFEARVSRKTGERRPARRDVDGAVLTATLSSWLPRRVGLALAPDTVRVEALRAQGRMRRQRIGGHLGTVSCWEGEVVVRTNAVGEWLLRVGALLGVGARVGFGFGRITVGPASCR